MLHDGLNSCYSWQSISLQQSAHLCVLYMKAPRKIIAKMQVSLDDNMSKIRRSVRDFFRNPVSYKNILVD